MLNKGKRKTTVKAWEDDDSDEPKAKPNPTPTAPPKPAPVIATPKVEPIQPVY